MKILVTGAAGFVGSHLCQSLFERSHAVVGLDDLSGGFIDNVPPGCEFVEGSILDHNLLERLFTEHRFDVVYHLAAYAAEGLSHFIKRFNYLNNVVGSVNLINNAVNFECSCFVFTSSIAVYGEGQTPMVETMTPAPTDSYGIAKYAVEQELRISHTLFGLDYIIFRPHNIYGEKQNLGDPYRNVVGIFMNQIMQGKPLTIYGDGTQQRAFTYIGDIIDCIARAPEIAEARNRTFNIGGDTPYTVNELAKTCAAAMGVEPEITYLPAREEVHAAYSDHTLAREILGCVPRTPLDEGLRRVAAWAREHGPRQGKPFEGIEVMKNLPPNWEKLIRRPGD